MRKYGVTQVVQASTSSLYAGLPMPFLETLDVRTPISPYAASKLGAEALGYTYTHLHGFDVTVLRYFHCVRSGWSSRYGTVSLC